MGENVHELKPGDYVVATVRRPGNSIYDLIGTNDMTTDDTYFERGINLRHGFLSEYYVDDAEYLVKIPRGLKEVGVLLEPLTVVEKGIAQVRVGGRVSDIGHAIQKHVEAHGFSVVREFVGHGIGT